MLRPLPSTVVALSLLVSVTIHAQGWQPPSGGAVEMFRQADRPFLVGALSGGAGGDGADGADPSPIPPELTFTERTLSVELAPVEHWDTPGSPAGNGVDGGRVHFFRPGDYSPSFSASTEGPIVLPVGNWYLTGDAPGWVTTHENFLQVRAGEKGGGGLVIPVMAACEVRLDEGAVWDGVDRLDVVSLTESSVYPLVPGEREGGRVPAGRLLTYAVAGDQVSGLGEERACEPGERIYLVPPAPPAAGRQALIVETGGSGNSRAPSHVVEPLVVSGGEGPPTHPDASVRLGERVYAFFIDLPAEPLQVQLGGRDVGPGASQGGADGPEGRWLEAREMSVREVPAIRPRVRRDQ